MVFFVISHEKMELHRKCIDGLVLDLPCVL